MFTLILFSATWLVIAGLFVLWYYSAWCMYVEDVILMLISIGIVFFMGFLISKGLSYSVVNNPVSYNNLGAIISYENKNHTITNYQEVEGLKNGTYSVVVEKGYNFYNVELYHEIKAVPTDSIEK